MLKEIPRMVAIPDTSIRLKVTNDCQWTCTFCHNEGTEIPANQQKRASVFLDPRAMTMPVVERMSFTPETMASIYSLVEVGVEEIHLTGGEPTLHPQLPEIVQRLTEHGLKVKMTTNGQTKAETIYKLAAAGISGITFSILSFNPEEFVKTQHIKSIPWAKAMIEREKQNILLAKSLGIDIKINTVVLGEFDYPRVDTVRQFAEINGIKLVLLPSLEEKETSQPAVFDYAEKYGGWIGGFEHTNNGKGSRHYQGENGLEIDAKYVRLFHPDVVCGGCEYREQVSCREKFYGLRMEFRGGEPYVRLCIQRTNQQTVMPLKDFLNRNIVSQL